MKEKTHLMDYGQTARPRIWGRRNDQTVPVLQGSRVALVTARGEPLVSANMSTNANLTNSVPFVLIDHDSALYNAPPHQCKQKSKKAPSLVGWCFFQHRPQSKPTLADYACRGSAAIAAVCASGRGGKS